MIENIRDWFSDRTAGEIAIIIAAVLLCIGFVGWSFTNTLNDMESDEEPIIDVDYIELFRNTENYKGKLVRIVGRVSENMTDNFSNRVIVFNDRFPNVRQNIYIILEDDYTKYTTSDVVVVVGRVSDKNGGLLNIIDSKVECKGEQAEAMFDKLNSADNNPVTSEPKTLY